MNTMIKNPYIGPRTFKRDEGHLFFGREREARDLIALVASERLVVFYAQSGAGKSSLVNTRLLPNLEAKEYEVLPVGRVSGEPTAGIDSANIYIFSLIRSLQQHEIDPLVLAKLSLPQFLCQLNYDEEGFFFDASLPETMTSAEDGTIIRRALVIDQFEELFSTHPEAWEQREDFFRQIAQAMQDDPHLWVVLVMREDYIASLDPYAHLVHGGMRVRYYMQRLGREAALKAVKSPVEELRPYAEGVAEKLIDDLCSIKIQKPDGTPDIQPGQYVEPVQLQVVCYGLWENLSPTGTQITEKDLQDVGDVNQSLGKYYDRRVSDVARTKNVRERLIREWFEKKLITAGGIRNMVLQELEPKPGELSDDVIQALQSDLVRAEKRGGATWYELTHDRLVEPILERNKIWFSENLSPLQRQATLWNDQGRNDAWLLSDQALVEVEEWAKQHQDELTKQENEFLEECQSKQLEKQQRQEIESQQQKLIAEQKLTRQRRLVANISIIATVVTLVAAGFALAQLARARLALASAEANQAVARTAQADAITQQSLAEANAGTAVANEQEAQKQASVLFSNSLAAQSNTLRDENFQVSMLLGIEAYKIAATDQSFGALLNIAQANPRLNQILNQHTAAVTTVAFSPDNKIFASASYDRTIILWDVKTRQPIGQPLSGHSDVISSIAFSPDGKTLASGGYDSKIILWNVQTRQRTAQLTSRNPISSMAFSPDGQLLATVSYSDGMFSVWDLRTGAELGRLGGNFSSVAFSPDGKMLVAGGYDNKIIWWDLPDLRLSTLIPNLPGAITSLAFSPNGRFLAAGTCSKLDADQCTEGGIILFNGEGHGTLGEPLVGHSNFISSVAFSPDSKILASGAEDDTIILWDVDTRQPIGKPLIGHSDVVTSVAFSPDGNTLASGSVDSTIILWDVKNNQPIGQSLIKNDDTVSSIAISPTGDIFASGSCAIKSADKCTQGEIVLWDIKKHQLIGKLTGHTDLVTSVAFSPDGKTLASGSYDNTVILWDVAGRQQVQELRGHTDIVTSVAFSPDGKILASSSYDRAILIWDVQTGQQIGEPLIGHTDAVTSVAFSPDGKTLASGSYDNTIILWDVLRRQPIHKLSGKANAVSSIAFSPDGKVLASGNYDNTIMLWDTQTFESIGQLTGHSNVISSVAFSPDGTTLVSSSYDNTIIVWDVDSRLPIGQPLAGHTDAVTSVVFSLDGKTLVSGGSDKNIILWDIDPQSLIEKSCQRASRNLTRAEWTRYITDRPYQATCSEWPLEPELAATPVETQLIPAATTATPEAVTATSLPFTTPTAGVGTAPTLFKVINVTEEDRLNIRAGPGVKYDIIGKIPKDGTGIEVTGAGVQADNTLWLPITYQGISGWVNSYYITKQ